MSKKAFILQSQPITLTITINKESATFERFVFIFTRFQHYNSTEVMDTSSN